MHRIIKIFLGKVIGILKRDAHIIFYVCINAFSLKFVEDETDYVIAEILKQKVR